MRLTFYAAVKQYVSDYPHVSEIEALSILFEQEIDKLQDKINSLEKNNATTHIHT